MNNGFFMRLAGQNIRKNSGMYLPYIITCLITFSVFYILRSLSLNPGIKNMVGSDSLSLLLGFGAVITGLFAVIFLFYTNSFLLKKRKKEFAVFNILGMEKRHIVKTLAIESLYVYMITASAGLMLGIALDKLMYMAVAKLIDVDGTLGFYISSEAVMTSLILFAVIFVLILLNSIRQVLDADPIKLLEQSRAAEREPKAKAFLAVLGVVCIAIGYYLSITIANPFAAFMIFFLAVMLIIAGTYLIFTAASIALLKILKKKKSYYYKPKHFISVSGMLYRMKQNAIGLANICILSTMLLVMISSTSSMIVGIEDIIRSRFGYDFDIYSYEDTPSESAEMFERVRELQDEYGLNITLEFEYDRLSFSTIQNGESFNLEGSDSLSSVLDYTILYFITLDDLNAASDTDYELNDGEILLYSPNNEYTYSEINIFDMSFEIVGRLDDIFCEGSISDNAIFSQFIVLKDKDELLSVYEAQASANPSAASEISRHYTFDTDASQEVQIAFYEEVVSIRNELEFDGRVESRAYERSDAYGIYGGIFFIGIFLSILFMMAAVLIIY